MASPRRALALSLSLFLSFCLHLLLFATWRLPDWMRRTGAETRIEASLLPPPAPAVRPKPLPPKKTPRLKPAPSSSVANTAVPGPGSDALAAPPIAPSTPAPPPVPVRALPGSGRISFDVDKGIQGFVIGRAVHEWTMDGDRYQIRSHMETIGLVALFADVQFDQTSTGHVAADGLHPDTFRDNRKGGQYRSDFDWAANTLRLADGTVLPVSPGAQDVLSVFYQMALYPLDTPEFTVMVTTGRKLERYTFHVEPDVPLVLHPHAGGAADGETEEEAPVMTWHLTYRDADGEQVEVWLARDDARLPVKIRYVDRKGGTLELVARNLNYSGKEQ